MFKFWILILLATLTISCDEDIDPSQIPSVVENTFKNNFPHATDIEWERYGDVFEVDFDFKKNDHSARIDNTGKLLLYKYDIPRDNLPSSLVNAIKPEYPQTEWEDQEVLVHGETHFYQLEIEGFFRDKKIIYDSLGNKTNAVKTW